MAVSRRLSEHSVELNDERQQSVLLSGDRTQPRVVLNAFVIISSYLFAISGLISFIRLVGSSERIVTGDSLNLACRLLFLFHYFPFICRPSHAFIDDIVVHAFQTHSRFIC